MTGRSRSDETTPLTREGAQPVRWAIALKVFRRAGESDIGPLRVMTPTGRCRAHRNTSGLQPSQSGRADCRAEEGERRRRRHLRGERIIVRIRFRPVCPIGGFYVRVVNDAAAVGPVGAAGVL